MNRPRLGFTLAELLVVLAIIAILAVLAYPATQRLIEGSRATACISHLRQLGVGLNLYVADHQNTMPTLMAGREKISDEVPVIDNTLDKYLTERHIFLCPADKTIGAISGTSYHWNVALNGQPVASLNFLQLTTSQSHIPILADKEGFHPYADNKVNILYADGHATKDLKFFTNP